jgi:hypothetical protein
MPFLPLLLLKLQSWSEHLADTRPHVRERVPVDAQDLDELLEMVNETHRLEVHTWLPKPFIETARGCVKAFVEGQEHTKEGWRAIGFDV